MPPAGSPKRAHLHKAHERGEEARGKSGKNGGEGGDKGGGWVGGGLESSSAYLGWLAAKHAVTQKNLQCHVVGHGSMALKNGS